MNSENHRQDHLILLAFAVGLILLVVPDFFFYSGTIDTPKFWLNIANTCLDAILFTAVFFFLRREIKKRRAVNQQLAEANQLKSEFLQIAAHDLRNPLSTILLTVSLIPPNPEGDIDPIEEIRSTVREMNGIIEGLLDAAALENETFRLNRAPVDLVECLHSVVERNRPLAERKKQHLELTAPAACIAEVDAGRIKQATDNLVSNAIKFSPFGVPIVVILRCMERKVRIEVADQGPGLTSGDKERLFGRFQRLTARPTGGESSVGLGLANARKLVELHGGMIGAESEGQGLGSRFWIELPIHPSHQSG